MARVQHSLPRGFRPAFFDPLSTVELIAIICEKFEERPAHSIAQVPVFDGPGLYAIYYIGGSDPLYRPLASYMMPVYVGSARSHNSATGAGIRGRDRFMGA
jgi:hypothetical protein